MIQLHVSYRHRVLINDVMIRRRFDLPTAVSTSQFSSSASSLSFLANMIRMPAPYPASKFQKAPDAASWDSFGEFPSGSSMGPSATAAGSLLLGALLCLFSNDRNKQANSWQFVATSPGRPPTAIWAPSIPGSIRCGPNASSSSSASAANHTVASATAAGTQSTSC